MHGDDVGAAEPPASQVGEGTHPAHSNISGLSWGSAVCPSLKHGVGAPGRACWSAGSQEACSMWQHEDVVYGVSNS